MPTTLDDLYRDIILDHHKSPRNYGELQDPDVSVEGVNPLCGDEVLLTMKVESGRISDVRLKSRGCSISRASGSMMTEAVRGKTLAEARELVEAFKDVMIGAGEAEGLPDELADLEALEGVKRYPVRIKCALLAWNTLLEALDEAERDNQACSGSGSNVV
ncbi:MAG: Fe-S cluster assembly sulfur transfer protein SufU [Armatimonadota bacterium]